MLNDIHHRMLSRPLQLEFAGWRTDTYKLQAAGWSISANQDVCNRSMRIAMEHRGLQMRAISHHVEFNYHGVYEGYRHEEYLSHILLPVHVMGREVQIHEMGTIDWAAFKPIDATPTFVQHRINKLRRERLP